MNNQNDTPSCNAFYQVEIFRAERVKWITGNKIKSQNVSHKQNLINNSFRRWESRK